MCKDTTQLYDFLSFMGKYKIVIPKIQRDYAQGRPSESAKREAFAERLVDALAGKPLMLDFVYGTVDDDNKDILYPLDGQQRLTTLFLLACLCRQAEENWIFSYESRRPAQFFMNELKDRDKMSAILSCAEQTHTPNISDCIKKSPWYFASWSEDVNIAGMLRMLDSLYCNLCDPKNKGLQLDFKKITFYVKPIPGNSTDFNQIYLKMNARGKALSGWDNLKACLDGVIPDGLDNKWNEEINLTWPDRLWELSGNRVEIIDTSMEKVVCYAFAATFRAGQHVDTNWENEKGHIIKDPTQEVEIEQIIEQKKLNQGRFDTYCREWIYIPKDKEDDDENQIQKAESNISKDHEIFLREFFDVLKTFFTCLTESEMFFDQQMSPWKLGRQKPDVCALASGNRGQIEDTLKRLLIYYALKKSKAKDPEKAADWRRIVWNLVYNTPISNIKVFRAVFIELKKLCENCSEDILRLLCNEGGDQNGADQNDEKLLNSFNIQLEEEQEKAERIISSDGLIPCGFSSWKDAIISAENHAFFHGCIRFLYRDTQGCPQWKFFDPKWKNAQKFFDDSGIKQDYKVNLTRRLFYEAFNFDSIRDRASGGNGYFFNASAESWLGNILKPCGDWRQSAVHHILMSSDDDDLPEFKRPNPDDDREYLKRLYNLLHNYYFPWEFIIDEMPMARFDFYDDHPCFYCRRYTNVIFIDCGNWKRNETLRCILENEDETIKVLSNNPIGNNLLFYGYGVTLEYKKQQFTWTPARGDYNKSCIWHNEKPEVTEIADIKTLREVFDNLIN